MRDGIEVALSIVSIRCPRSLIHCQNLIRRDSKNDSIRTVSHGLNPVTEIVEFPISVMLEKKDLASQLKTPQEGIFLKIRLIFCEDVVPYLRHRIVEYYNNTYKKNRISLFHFEVFIIAKIENQKHRG